MKPKKLSRSNGGAFYTGLIQEAHDIRDVNNKKLGRRTGIMPLMRTMGFVPCRNALFFKSSSRANNGEVTVEGVRSSGIFRTPYVIRESMFLRII